MYSEHFHACYNYNEWKKYQTDSSWFYSNRSPSLSRARKFHPNQIEAQKFIYLFDTAANISPQTLSLSLSFSSHFNLYFKIFSVLSFDSLQLFDRYICTCAWNSIGFDSTPLFKVAILCLVNSRTFHRHGWISFNFDVHMYSIPMKNFNW